MTATTATPRSLVPDAGDLLDAEWRRARVTADLAAMPGLVGLLERLDLWPSLDAEVARCVPPMFVAPHPNRELRRRHGLSFDVAEVGRVLEFCRRLRHVKGRLAGRPLVPDLWQVVYFLAPIFGWRQGDGNRFYRTGWLEVPRKNGKSTLAAALALYLLMADSNLRAGRLYEPGAEVVSAATTTKQARAVFGPAEAMARRSPAIAARLGIRAGESLVYERTMSTYQVLSGDPSKADQKMGGNTSGAVIDETHAHRDGRTIEAIESGTAGRDQPLVMHLTTAGDDVDGTIYAELHDLAVAIAEGKVTDVRTWAVIYTVPDELVARWNDPDVWAVANPGLDVSVSREYLADSVAKAHRSTRKQLAFCRLHLNYRTSSLARWLDMDLYDAGAAHVAPTYGELRDATGYLGLDLASTTDLAALAAVIPRWVPDPADGDYEVEVLEVVLRCWTPADRIRTRAPRERELFGRWAGDGWLTLCPGETIDYDMIEAEAFALARHFGLARLSFDRWGSKQLVGHFRSGGLTVAEVAQSYAGLSPAMKEAEKVIAEGRLRTGGNPLLRYAFEHLVVEVDGNGNVKPHRGKSTGHIDPAVAVVLAIDGYARDRLGGSVYEDRGLITA